MFEWDAHKAQLNWDKHGVSFEEAQTVFADQMALTYEDHAHGRDGSRFITLGFSYASCVLLVVSTDRQHNVRIISARKATPQERKSYEQAH